MSSDQDSSVGSLDMGMGENLVASLDKLLLDDANNCEGVKEIDDSAEPLKPSCGKKIAVVLMRPVKARAMSISSEEATPSGGEEHECMNVPNAKEERIVLLKELLETYFSDNYLTRDIFLLKHFRKSKEGWISLKFMSTYKKIKRTAKNRTEVEEAVRLSSQLELNENCTKVRRLASFPPCISDYIPTRMTLIGELPLAMRNLTALSNFLGYYGNISSLQILRPGVNLPDILWETAYNFPEVRAQWCAIVEYEEIEAAGRLAADINESKTDSNIPWALELVMHWKNRKYSDSHEKTFWTESIKNRCRSCPSSGYSSPCLTPEQSPHGRHHDFRGMSKRERIIMSRHTCQTTCCQHTHFPTNCSPTAPKIYHRVQRQSECRSPKLASSKLTAETCDNWRRAAVAP